MEGLKVLPLVSGVSARKFNDDRLGRTLDAIEPHLREIWIEIIMRAFEHYDIATSIIGRSRCVSLVPEVSSLDLRSHPPIS